MQTLTYSTLSASKTPLLRFLVMHHTAVEMHCMHALTCVCVFFFIYLTRFHKINTQQQKCNYLLKANNYSIAERCSPSETFSGMLNTDTAQRCCNTQTQSMFKDCLIINICLWSLLTIIWMSQLLKQCSVIGLLALFFVGTWAFDSGKEGYDLNA